MGCMRNVYLHFVGKPEGNITLIRPKRRLEDNIKMDLGKIRWEVDWIYLIIETTGVFL
jgi:hypothetical protein